MTARGLTSCTGGLAALALSLSLTLTGCRGGGEAGAVGTYEKAPIVVLSIDTLRSDHLPAYGYHGVATPAIDALRADSVLFERAYSHIPLTLPSHVSMLTGLLPPEHGVRDNVGYVFRAAGHPWLPSLLKQAGYATGAAVSAYVLRAETGILEGFDFFESAIDVKPTESLGQSQRPGAETAALARGWLDQVAGKPFFLLLHLYEPHAPYEAGEPWVSRVKLPYDAEIAAVDAIVGDFVADLERRDLYDDAIVVLLSDHGEGLGEHGEQEHGILLYRESLQVPLMVKLPGARRAGETVAAPAGLADLFPTLARLVGLELPKEIHGRSLFDLGGPETPARPLYAETFYPRLHLGWSELASVVEDRFHYIHGPDPELYDLAADPGEKTNVLTRERRSYAALRREVEARMAPLEPPAEADPETAQKLAALGYLGSSVKVDPGEVLPDPKSRIDSLRDFGRAFYHYGREEYDQAIPLFERLLAANPKMVDAWEHLGQSLQKLGRQDEALRAYEKAMEISGGVAHVALATGSLLLQMDRLDEARAHAELALPTSPASARSLLAQVALASKDPATAEKEARAALESRGSRIGPLLTLAQVQAEQEKLEEALATTQQAVDELEKMPGSKRFHGLFFVRGDVLARLGRDAEAEAAFLREVADSPTDPKAYTRLAVLYASQGRAADAVGTLRRLVEANESPAAYAEAVKTLRVLGDPQGAAALLRHALARHPDSRELRALAG